MKQDNFKMDSRNVEDIRNQIENLAKSYVPEWNFDKSNPDIGSVLALIFANQMGRNVERFNSMMERYRTELVNLMEISPLPAHPAEATVLMNIATEADEGVAIPAESRLLAELEDENIVFETAFPVYLTPSKLRTIFMTSAEKGRVLSIFGGLKRKNYILEEKVPEDLEESNELKPFDLFQFAKEGIERQAVVLYHSNIFDVENETIYCRIEGSADLLKKIGNGEIRFLYYSEDGFIPVENCQVMGNHILLVKEKPNKKVTLHQKEYSVFVLEALEPQKESISIASISFSSAGSPRYAQFVGNGMTDYEVERFQLFGDTLTLFAECYIGLDHYFAKKDSKICITFHASFEERMVGISKQEEENLKIIKRKPKVAEEVHLSYAYPEDISIEYFNGIGWKRLQCDKEYRRMFAEAKEGDYELRFNCPEDWENIEVGGYHGRSLRIQLLRSDNCYYQPCMHMIPIISDLMVAYTYENRFKKPEDGTVFSGTDVTDLTKVLQTNEAFTAFSKGNYTDTSLYLGFDKKFEQGPISLWWQIDGEQRNQCKKLHFYYSTIHGFKEMKVIDYTVGLTRSGIMMFLPPADMAVVPLEGERRCWIKITNENDFHSDVKVKQIALNAVTALNIETLPVEEFYLDEVKTQLVFPLGTEGILDAEVWVNEKNELSEEVMEKMREEMPDRVRMERNYLGEISEFYVKWEETDQFYYSKPDDRHYILDRMNKCILFGNGLQIKVPRSTDGVAFTVKLRCCRGVKGNVPAGTIRESSSNWLFVQDIYNPEPAFGGSNMESIERVLQRGAGILSARGRLVTEQDYERAVLHFSDAIDKVSVISGYGKDGNYNERMLYIVLLMKDYMKGKNSFYRMQNDLKEHLLKNCELSIDSSELQIETPIFVNLSVDVWASILKIEDSFEVQNLAKIALETYLNPIKDEHGSGWNIGVLPRKSQIMMRLNALKRRALIRHIVVTAKYEDENGVHEVDIDQLKVSPFMVVVNGTHHIHISPMEEV